LQTFDYDIFTLSENSLNGNEFPIKLKTTVTHMLISDNNNLHT